jgi:hypothetical protein
MEPLVKATITVDNKVVTFEGPRDFVDAQVAKYIGGSSLSDTNVHSIISGASSDLTANAVLSEKQLVLMKKPKGHLETVAVLAFALSESGNAEFNEEDMRRAYRRAEVRPPKVIGQAIRDAKNVFQYVEVGSKRGSYKLSNHGDRTVRFDLPHSSRNKA